MAMTPTAPGGGDHLDFLRAFTFVTEDPDWIKKILLGGVFTLLGIFLIPLPLVAGYGLRVIGRTARCDPRPLPEWDDWGGLFQDGLKAIGLYLACALAVLLVVGVLGCALALVAGGLSAGAREVAGGIAAIGIVGLYGLLLLLGLILLIYLPAAFTRLAVSGRFAAGFEFGDNLDLIKRNLPNYCLAILVYIVAHFAAQFGVILCCVGILPASFWATCSFAWALGEVARRDATLGWQPGHPVGA